MEENATKELDIQKFKDDYKVHQPNPMLMVYDNMANIWQTRFLKAYQAKVRPSDPDSYCVRFSLDEFLKAVNLSQAPSIKTLKRIAQSVRTAGFDFYEYRRKYGNEKIDPKLIKEVNLFEYFEIGGSEQEGYYVEARPTRTMEAMLEKIGELGYVDYEVKNVLAFSSKRTIRFYEFLKRSEGKSITIKVDELKIYLGISKDKYQDIKSFNRDVIKKEIEEINRETDINVEWEPLSARSRGARTIGYRFSIKTRQQKVSPSSEPADPAQITIDDWSEDVAAELQAKREQREEICYGFSDEIFDEFTDDQLRELANYAVAKVSESRKEQIKKHESVLSRKDAIEFVASKYIEEKILYVNARKAKKSRYAYILAAVKDDYQ